MKIGVTEYMSARKKVMILGDSLPLLRSAEGISYEDTYGYLVKKHIQPMGSSLYVVGKRRNDTTIQLLPENLQYDLKQFHPDIVITHFGIVDCAPRLFTRPQYQLISSLPQVLKNMVVSFFSKRRKFFTRRYPKVYVELNDFEKNMQEIINQIKKIGAETIIINIAKPPDDKISRSHNFLQNVNNYNKVLSKLAEKNNCQIIDFHTQSKGHPEYLISDGIHLSRSGNKVMARMVIESLGNLKE